MGRLAGWVRTRRPCLIAAVCAAILLGDACGGGGAATLRPTLEAVAVPSGERVSLVGLRGSPVLLASWATWCAPCRLELPQLQALADARRGDGLRVIAVNVDSSGADEHEITKFARELGLRLPIWRDTRDQFAAHFRGVGVPMSVAIDRSGRIVHTWYGRINPEDSEVRTVVNRLIEARE